MTKFIYLIAFSGTLIAAQAHISIHTLPAPAHVEADSSKPAYYGEKITADNAITIEQMKKLLGNKKELAVKVIAPVESVCKKKGCWMQLKAADGSNMRVTFKDYGFFVPVNTQNKTAIVKGIVRVEETSVADLKHYAKDKGATQQEIDAITSSKRELVFEADGVILK
jgi:hypothetical protein